jgi:hypothetical protein
MLLARQSSYPCSRTRKPTIYLKLWAARGQFLTSPLGAKFDPQGWSWPLGGKLSPRAGWRPSVRPFVLLNIKECSPLGLNEGWAILLWDKVHPWGAKFTPRGNLIPGGELMLC